MYSDENYLMIGNTRWHWARKIEEDWEFFHTSPNPIEFQEKDCSKVFWASVSSIPKKTKFCPSKRINLHDVPLINLPSNLGIDRALASWSAFKKHTNTKNNKGLIIVDAGTILSITRISERGEFAGGQLIGGLSLQLSAMAEGAYNLEKPIIKIIPKETFQYETNNAMIKGTVDCLIGVILNAYKESNLTIFLCGGDAPILLDELKKMDIDIQYHPNLVLEGMINIRKNFN